MQLTELHCLKQMWFYLHLANLILAWNSTKSVHLNGRYSKLQFSTYTWFSYALSHLSRGAQYGIGLISVAGEG